MLCFPSTGLQLNIPAGMVVVVVVVCVSVCVCVCVCGGGGGGVSCLETGKY